MVDAKGHTVPFVKSELLPSRGGLTLGHVCPIPEPNEGPGKNTFAVKMFYTRSTTKHYVSSSMLPFGVFQGWFQLYTVVEFTALPALHDLRVSLEV